MSVFCDDIRMELGNKPSFMGVYTGDMLVQADGPVQLPKLSVATFLMIPINMEFTNLRVVLQQDLDGAISELARLDADQVERPPIPATKNPQDDRYWKLNFQMALTQFVIERESTLKVRAYIDDGEEIRLGSLPIKILPPPVLEVFP